MSTRPGRLLIFAIALVSMVNVSRQAVVLPDETDEEAGYMEKTKDIPQQYKLNQEQFQKTKANWMSIKQNVDSRKFYSLLLSILPDEFDDEVTTINKIKTETYRNGGCRNGVQNQVARYIAKRYNVIYSQRRNPNDDVMAVDEYREIAFLISLLSLTGEDGRFNYILLKTLYGNNLHTDKNLKHSAWLSFIRSPDPLFGESYMSYALRIIKQKKMPLPKELIPTFFDQSFALNDEFDIWPELDATYIMYYLLKCDLFLDLGDPSKDRENSKN